MKQDVVALWLAARDQRTLILAKIAAAVVAAYALSPIDLIPDLVPVLGGHLDDVIIGPLGIMLPLRLMPAALMAEFGEAATQRLDRPTSLADLAFVMVLWLAAAALLIWWLCPRNAF